ncbi:cephalosporin esterase [Phellopilus nigrolimitatus]|nr:cephalosporin esterase [Phellopilus nigrolimitatus]
MKCFGVLVALGFLSLTRADSPQIVDLGYATYQGTFNSTSNITNFLSIRYAAPPVGKLRFQAPAAPLNMSSDGIQMADTQPHGCPHAGRGISITSPFRSQSKTITQRQNTQIEDCLFLNVHVSGPINSAARMPVIFWIHGGGYVGGTTASDSGADLVREAGGGIVAIELEYRLGVFGFLPGSEVKENGALNAGLLDQQFALQWVQQFVHLFGGDPTKVTIWGESAGAGSVLQHLVTHNGNTHPPLFRAAMTSSTFLPSQYRFNDPIPEKLYSETVQLSGCANATSTFECLVDADAGTLQNANVLINKAGFFGTFVTVPVVDGEFIVERPVETISRGKLNGDMLLSVTNTFEGTIFVNSTFSEEMSITDYVTQLFPLFNETQINETVSQYTGIGLDTVNDQAIGIMGESIFICPTYLLLNAFQGRARKGLFAIPPGTHGSDVAYYFPGTTGPPFKNAQFSASFAGGFLGFVKSLDPNEHPVANIITPNWDLYVDGQTEMLFNRTEGFRPDIRPIKTDPNLLERCAFWKSVAPSVPQ